MTRVFIAPGDSYHAAIDMFNRAGFEVVKDYEGVDLLVLLGGTDVNPALYGEERGPYTQSPDLYRDDIEVALYKRFLGIPKVGICRGGQLLNVLNGGKMIQHLGKCISGDYDAIETNHWSQLEWFGKIRVDHHQGIVPAKGNDGYWTHYKDVKFDENVVLHVCYEDTKSLCFQGHPEWGHKGTEDYFFELIERYFGFARKDTKCAA